MFLWINSHAVKCIARLDQKSQCRRKAEKAIGTPYRPILFIRDKIK